MRVGMMVVLMRVNSMLEVGSDGRDDGNIVNDHVYHLQYMIMANIIIICYHYQPHYHHDVMWSMRQNS